MKCLVKRIVAGCGALLLLCAFSACKAEKNDPLETSSEKSILDSLTSPSSETTAPRFAEAAASEDEEESAIQLSYAIPEKFEIIFNMSFNDIFDGKEATPIGAGEGSDIYESEDYPGLKLHFDADKNFVSAIEGNISKLVPGKETLNFAEFKQIFGSDSISYSDMTNGYVALVILDRQYKLICGEFPDEDGTITTFTLTKTPGE